VGKRMEKDHGKKELKNLEVAAKTSDGPTKSCKADIAF
jgi:hypothetical protein